MLNFMPKILKFQVMIKCKNSIFLIYVGTQSAAFKLYLCRRKEKGKGHKKFESDFMQAQFFSFQKFSYWL